MDGRRNGGGPFDVGYRLRVTAHLKSMWKLGTRSCWPTRWLALPGRFWPKGEAYRRTYIPVCRDTDTTMILLWLRQAQMARPAKFQHGAIARSWQGE
jgi:hypothetical protein